MATYVPEKGDFITLSFDPQSGHEQKGRRPALVLSNFLFNRATGLAIVCPITKLSRSTSLLLLCLRSPARKEVKRKFALQISFTIGLSSLITYAGETHATTRYPLHRPVGRSAL